MSLRAEEKTSRDELTQNINVTVNGGVKEGKRWLT